MAAQRVRDYLSPFLGEREVREVRADDLRGYRLWLEARALAPRTVRHVLSDARCMFGWAADSELLDRSPFPRRIMPRLQETPPDRLTEIELARVLAIGEPQAFVIRLAVSTGLRWGELCRARADHLISGMLTVAQTKSGRVRRVPVPESMASEVRRRLGRLVPYVEGSAGSFNKLVRRRSGVAGFHVHQLRHTFACRWIERGGSLPSLQQVLGHASVTTTQHYAKLSDEYVRREAERVSGFTLYDRSGPARATPATSRML
jgi:integrase